MPEKPLSEINKFEPTPRTNNESLRVLTKEKTSRKSSILFTTTKYLAGPPIWKVVKSFNNKFFLVSITYILKHKIPTKAVEILYWASSVLIVPNQRRRGLTPKLMSYMSATAGCDREQSEALIHNSTTPPRFAKSHYSPLLKEEKENI
jgi:hypothetical protein